MKAAIIREPGGSPVYGEFPEPAPSPNESRIAVTAAALSHVVRSRANGTHYSAYGRFPSVVGIDGVGRMQDGRRVYFALPRTPYGSMAEWTVVPCKQCMAVPDRLDDVTAAAIAIPGMSSWAAYTERAKLKRGETVLINGATGIAGRLAVQIAKHLGAGKVIATGRSAESLRSLADLGADLTISLLEPEAVLVDKFRDLFAEGVDIVVDYLWGKNAEHLLIAAAKAAPDAVPIRFIQVGSAGSSATAFPGAVLRSSPIELMGSGLGSVSRDRLLTAIREVLYAAAQGNLKIAVKPVNLSEVEQAWRDGDGGQRTVITVDERKSIDA